MDLASDVACLPAGSAAVLAFPLGTPESLALPPVHGRPLLCYLLDELDSLGFSQAILCTDEDGAVAEVFGGRYRRMKIRYCSWPAGASHSIHGEGAGTRATALPASRLRQAFSVCEGMPVLAFGDMHFLSKGLEAFVARCSCRAASVLLAATGNAGGGGRLASAGICWVKSASALCADLAAELLAMETLESVLPERLCVLDGTALGPATDPACLETFLKPRSAKDKAIFLDRDGTVNVEKNYLYRPEDLEFVEGMPEFIALWRRWGYRSIVVTNQSGIARGYYREEDMERLHACMNERLRAWGARIDAFYHCPHYPDLTGTCRCRKPELGLIEKAVFDYNLDPRQCLLFGDKDSDILAGQACGIFSVKVHGGSGLVSMPNRIGSNLQTKTFPWPPREENQAISR